MPTFELIGTKEPHSLVAGNCIIHNDSFWKVIDNYKILGVPSTSKRLLIVMPAHLHDGNGVQAIELNVRTDAYLRTE